MPSRIELAENLWLMYICLQNSDYKAIDFNAVGEITKLKAPAARMRFTRLRNAIENGTLMDTHGKHFQSTADKTTKLQRKRKKTANEERGSEGDDEEALPPATRKKASMDHCNETKRDDYGEINALEPEAKHRDTQSAELTRKRSSPESLASALGSARMNVDTTVPAIVDRCASPTTSAHTALAMENTTHGNEEDVATESAPARTEDHQERRNAVVDPVRQLLAPHQPEPVSSPQ